MQFRYIRSDTMIKNKFRITILDAFCYYFYIQYHILETQLRDFIILSTLGLEVCGWEYE